MAPTPGPTSVRATATAPSEDYVTATPPLLAPPTAPTDPGAGLGAFEVEAILDLKRDRPSMGPAQIRAQLTRFRGVRLALRAIVRVLRNHCYELTHRGDRPQEEQPPSSAMHPLAQ